MKKDIGHAFLVSCKKQSSKKYTMFAMREACDRNCCSNIVIIDELIFVGSATSKDLGFYKSKPSL